MERGEKAMGVIRITQEDRQLIKELHNKLNKGEKIKSKDLTDLYNRVTDKNVTNTNCGSCLRQRLLELVNIMDQTKQKYKKNVSEEDKKFLDWINQLPSGHYPDFDKVVDMYNRVFGTERKYTNCLPCIKSMLIDLNELYE